MTVGGRYGSLRWSVKPVPVRECGFKSHPTDLLIEDKKEGETMVELEVQRFLRDGRTLEDLTAAYSVKATIDPALGVVMLNYYQLASPMEEKISQECRSLVCLYFHRSKWRIATKGTPDASGPVNTHTMTFADLVRRSLVDMGSSFAELTARLNPTFFDSFELTAPENRIIVPHEERRLTWLAAWEAKTLIELETISLPDLPTPRVKEYPLRTIEEVMAAVEAIAPYAAEGFIVWDAAHRRVKIKKRVVPND